MKLIIAYIQPEKLRDVKKELFKKEVYRVSVSNAIGAGQQAGYTETYRGVVHEINLLKKVRLEIAVNDNFIDITVEAIMRGAKTGNIGDGKIFIVPLEECVRIRTGEKGSNAIG